MSAGTIPLAPYGPTAGRKHLEGKSPRPETVTVDLHNHMRILAADDLVRAHVPADHHPATKFANPLTLEINRKFAQERRPASTDIDHRVADMDRMDLDVMAVSCAPTQFYYMTEPALGHEASQIVNDGIAANIRKHPDRFVGLGTVPLQHTDLAIRELDRTIGELGFRGVQIGARVRDEELSAERLDPFWARCQELDIPIFIHPSSFASPRFSRHFLANVIGNPLDTTVAVHYLIFDGVMERFPRIKFYLSHGGAFAAAYGARMDHAFGARLDAREKINELPSTYLRRFYIDTIVFSTDQLHYLVQKLGADHIAMGTDYPADMGEYDPIEHVYQTDSLSEADREKICGLNALKLMNLEESRFRNRTASPAAGRARVGDTSVEA